MIRSIVVSLALGIGFGLSCWVAITLVILMAQTVDWRVPAFIAIAVSIGTFWADLITSRRGES